MTFRFLILLVCVYLSGCTTSPYVFSIGANSIEGSTVINNTSKSIEVSLNDSKLIAHEDAGFLMPSYPYQSLTQDSGSNALYDITFNLKDIKWENKFRGKITLLINGESKEFDVWKKNNELRLKHYYRKWYGYPAQAFLLVSYPLDAVVVIVGGVGYVLATPFINNE